MRSSIIQGGQQVFHFLSDNPAVYGSNIWTGTIYANPAWPGVKMDNHEGAQANIDNTQYFLNANQGPVDQTAMNGSEQYLAWGWNELILIKPDGTSVKRISHTFTSGYFTASGGIAYLFDPGASMAQLSHSGQFAFLSSDAHGQGGSATNTYPCSLRTTVVANNPCYPLVFAIRLD
jgi:hypothetical protein